MFGRSKKPPFNAAFLAAPFPMAIINAQGALTATNDAFVDIFGQCATASELLKHCIEINSHFGLPNLSEPWQGPVHWQGDDGREADVFVSIASLDGEGALLMHAQRLGEHGVKQQKALQSLGVFAGSIAHDLNNVLTAVLGHVSFLRLLMSESGTQEDSISAIEEGARRAAEMTRQIMDFARGEELEFKAVDLGEATASALNLIKASLPDNVCVNVKIEDSGLYVYGDESQLSQLVLNLAVNARDALPDGGNIEIKVGRRKIDERLVSPEYILEPGEYGCLSVRDDGVGISAETRKRIFEPFFTTKSAKGTGLGLATVKSIVEALRGAINVETGEGKGALFEIYLPTCKEAVAAEAASGQASELRGGSEQILVVDDEEGVRTVMQRILEHLGYCVDVAHSGIDAVNLFNQRGGDYDLVILDMIMPQMAGDEVFRKLRKINPRVGVLIATGYSSDQRTKAVLENGGLGLIQKPFAVEELAEKVRWCLARSRK